MDKLPIQELSSLSAITAAHIRSVKGSYYYSDTPFDSFMPNFLKRCRRLGRKTWMAQTLNLINRPRKIGSQERWRYQYDRPSENRLRDEGFANVISLLEDGYFNNVRDLRICIEACSVSPTSMERFFKLFQTKPLKNLRVFKFHFCFPEFECFQGNDGSDESKRHELIFEMFWENFGEILASRNLDTMTVSRDRSPYYEKTENGVRAAQILADQFLSGHLRSLRVLNLRGIGIGCAGMRFLGVAFQLHQKCHIETLKLESNQIGEEGARFLARGLGFGLLLRRLVILHLSWNNLGDEGFVSLANSFQLDQSKMAIGLQILGLAGNDTGDTGLQSLAKVLEDGKLPKLTSLRLQGNRFNVEGQVALANAFKSGHLRDLQSIYLQSELSHGVRGLADGLVEIAHALQHGSLPNLKEIQLVNDFAHLPLGLVKVLANTYRLNLHLTADLVVNMPLSSYHPHLYEIHELRLANIKRLKKLRVLEDGKDVAGRHGKVFFCGDPWVGKTTLRLTLTAERGWTQVNEADKVVGSLCCWKGGRSRREGTQEQAKDLEKLTREHGPTQAGAEEHEPTRGIEVANIQSKDVTISLWDLAGQHDYEVLHSAFLPDMSFANGQATFFVIVCNAKDFSEAKGQLLYWMRFISSNSLKDVQSSRRRRVFVVLNCFHGQGIPKEQVSRWTDFLDICKDGFGRYLNLHVNPFVADVRSKEEVKDFRITLFNETKEVLQERMMPNICHVVQEEGIKWAKDPSNSGYPVLKWDAYRSLGFNANFEEKKVAAAAEYLHEAGHIILFGKVPTSPGNQELPSRPERRSSIPERTSSGSKRTFSGPKETSVGSDGKPSTYREVSSSSASIDVIEAASTLRGDLVIVDPQWFCKQVVGNFLLPKHMRRKAEDIPKMFREGRIPILTLGTNNFQVPPSKIDEVVKILCRLGICYKLEGNGDYVFVPALIEETEVPGWSATHSQHVEQGEWVENGAWVMGFSLKVKDKQCTLLPISVLRKLQVNLSLDKAIGNRPDSEYYARKDCVAFKFAGLSVIIEYSSQKQDRMDVLVKPLLKHISKRDQINAAQKFVDRISAIVEDTSVGVELDKRIIKPWSAASRHLKLKERDIKLAVATVIEEMMERGEPLMRQWIVRGEAVWDDDVLSDVDLSDFLQMISEKLKLTTEAKKSLDTSNTKYVGSGEGPLVSAVSTASAPLENLESQDVSLYIILHDYLEMRFSEVERNQSRGFSDVIRNQNQMYAEFMHLKGSIKEILQEQRSLNVQIQNLERFAIAEKDSSIPRFAYVTNKGKGSQKWWIELTQVRAETLALRFLCESFYSTGAIHEVSDQEGIDVSKMKDWARRLLPMLIWTLKVGFVCTKIVGNAVLPGLGLFFGAGSEVSKIFDKINPMTSEAAEVSKRLFEGLDAYVIKQALGRDAVDQEGTSNRSWVPNTERQLRGEAKEAVRKLLYNMSEEERRRQVGLSRVSLKSTDGDGGNHVTWICKECCKQYELHRPDSIHDLPIIP